MSTARSVRKNQMRNGIGTNERMRQEYADSVARMTQAEKLKRMMQNGVTLKDVDEAYKRGYAEGREQSAKPYIRVYCAAMVLAMREKLNLGTEDCGIVIARALEILNGDGWIDPEDLEQRARDEVGVDLGGMEWT